MLWLDFPLCTIVEALLSYFVQKWKKLDTQRSSWIQSLWDHERSV